MTSKTVRGKGSGRTKLSGRTVLLLTITVLLAAGCGAPMNGPQTPTSEVRESFSARRESEDGAIVAWSGYTDGYEPGMEAEFDVTIKNETEETWRGRYCLQLLDRELPQVIATLEQRPFTLEPGVGFSDTITVRIPEGLDEGAYGLSLPVRRPGGPMVDLVPIQIGETDEVRRSTTQQDMDAALEACPPPAGGDTDPAAPLVAQAKADLAQRLDLSADQIEVQRVEATEFPDASLGVPEPDKVYAQVITPGFVIELTVAGQVYRYHASDERVVAAPSDEGQPPSGRITVKGVEVTAAQVVVRGTSTLPDGACVSAELWADGALQTWWPADACASTEQGEWELVVPLGAGQELQPGVQYMVRAYQPGGPNVVATFPFDLNAPPAPPSPAPEDDPALLVPDGADILGQASVDLKSYGEPELVFLAGFGGAPDRLGYDFLALLVLTPSASAEAVAGYELAWNSGPLVGDRAESLEAQDVNGDGRPEVLCVQAMGAAGQALQVFAWSQGSYVLLRPRGGHFDGQEAFGENGVRLEDVDGDGIVEILGSYGPAASGTDVYGWDGHSYVYRQTLGGSAAG